MRTVRNLAPTALLLVAETAGLVALVRLGHADGFSVPFAHLAVWVRQSPPADVLAATLRVVALGGLCWLLATTALYGVARAVRATRVINALGWCTLPAIRRVVDGALAVSLMTTVVASGAGVAHAAPPPTTSTTSPRVRSGRAHVLESFPPAPTTSPSSPAQPARSSDLDPPSPAPSPTPPADAPVQRHVVVAGDNLWTIAAAEVARSTGRSASELTDREIATYWVELVTAARPGLRSGNPDRIYPGEVVPLP
ncbi:MAG TPA: hypothetical protein VF441_04415 [Acidimicrobiia bacterium]